MKQGIIGAFVALVAVAVIVLVVVFSGVVNVGADQQPSALTEWFLHTAMERSVEARARDIEVPPLDDPEMVKAGASHYDSMCVPCHGAPGVNPGELAQGLNPKPPELAKTRPGAPEELFWVTKHGIQMTGMPAWGITHDDESIWGVVALLTRFEGMTAAEYRKLVEAGGNHHGGGSAKAAPSGDPARDARYGTGWPTPGAEPEVRGQKSGKIGSDGHEGHDH